LLKENFEFKGKKYASNDKLILVASLKKYFYKRFFFKKIINFITLGKEKVI